MTAPAPRPCIVVGYDGSAASRAAVDVAAERAVLTGASVVVVHAGDDDAGAHRVEALLLEGHDRLADVDWETVIAHGGAASALLGEADRRDAVEIVMGTRGRGRATSLLGSVAHEVVRRATCPVTIVPQSVALRRGA